MEQMARGREGTDTADSVLWAVGPRLREAVDIDALLNELVTRIAAALEADRGTIYLLDPERGELVSRAGHLPEVREIRLKLGQGIAGAVATTGQTLNLPSADADTRFFREVDRRTGYRTRNVLATPVRDRDGRTLGVVQVLNARRGQFDDGDEDRIRRLAAEVAVALEHTSLYPSLRAPVEGEASARPATVPHPRYNGLVGDSPAMRKVYDTIARAAPTDATVLLRGESGTGKELVARAVHCNSARRERPFVKVDCTTIPDALMESELFGHEKGAFTGANERVLGKCEQAAGGTLFLDEIGELPLALQGKLLRFIQERAFERVGGRRTQVADARVIVATHRDLEAMVARGAFREDLYYRIRVVQIRLPPLRERGPEDLLRLADHFVEIHGRRHRGRPLTLTPDAREALVRYQWPGNVRELENCLESAAVLCDGEKIDRPQLPLPAPAHEAVAPTPDDRWTPAPLAEVERRHIQRTLSATQGNVTKAAALLGIGRNTLYRKMREYKIA